ncbi:Fe-S cluster assembly protein SufD [Candidatus Phycosocius spiralis]|uniref:Fe-S cluster assembly protein SufD n=1 Tax=Candidatus Phycosocius spiralis TaxID=2815099 RepID=A0ABQ4PSZ2_9PROT|nr:Fe-S cluster assembly protein SufD [Candidatus Phycosocius spiralis]GIU66083.1 Fe-S cluster assembly protein SufD [Candidatus Phycosocius spiralis]
MVLVAPSLADGELAVLEALAPTQAGEAARASILAQGLPTKRNEAFKWSDLRAALQDGVPKPSGSAGMVPACWQDALVIDFTPEGFGLEGDKDAGLVIESEESLPLEDVVGVESLAAGFAPRALVLRITSQQSRPIFLRRHPGAPMRVRVELKAETNLTLVDTSLGEAGLASALIEAELATGATLTRYSLQQGGNKAIDLSHCRVTIGAGATYEATSLMFGAHFARAETLARLIGAGGYCRIRGAYLLAGSSHADMTSKIIHLSPDTFTEELFKGAVQDRARGVFQGKILVERGAQQTDARQNHHALMLTEGAQIDAKPELEIYADDVQCAHGNTIGALDEEALFYLRQRGIPENQAKALLIEAFVTEVFDTLSEQDVRDWFNDQARTWLKSRVG